MENYYDVLGIGPEASTREVKSAFRRQAKKQHPDVSGSREGKGGGRREPSRAADAAMRLLLEAYRVLSDPERRRLYDRTLRRSTSEEGGFDYRRFLKSRPDDPESQAKLVVFDLLHELEDEALSVYERAKSLGDFRLERWLDRGEAMDTEFCIAEEYEKRERWLKAYSIYRRLIEMERERPWFRYFFDVVALRFRTLVLFRLPKVLDEEDFVDRLEEAAALGVSRKDTAQFLRKMAEVQLRRGETAPAVDSLRRASELEPRLAGLTALRKRAGLQTES
ncbi:MAG TPA: J domain-containing protein [Rectinemataceae bacterium]|nr:J domain-containing protein [Rectinemataceae bacterium]